MNRKSITVREVTPDDDADDLLKLINDTLQRYVKNNTITVTGAIEPPAYVAVCDGQIVAVAEISLSEFSRNGNLAYGYLADCEDALPALVDECGSYVVRHGGSKLFAWVNTKFGQVRNEAITVLERCGFQSDEYSTITCQLSLTDWSAPDSFDADGIEAVTDMETGKLNAILLEDGEDAMAELVNRQFPAGPSRSRVTLGIRNQETGEIAGLAYYEVFLYRPDAEEAYFEAIGFGLHFRPKYKVAKADKKRLLQGALQSMKQLDVRHVLTRMTLNHFDVFAAMAAEGFTNDTLEELNSLRLTKNV
ncbi:hypothetical protein [Paenibacillus spongiae]|uniref:GNAT family N-acetyltransferase n=1 Tax=Paenibacillus spongiae TaxID=2909671 RepID=A0ABY5S6T7_9BACL|nr:hypothetical protein [Paenibacillus spongiae]UVI29300.1 hypothetical protein L1F29_28360 [Paenibacillus spongiae]